jgi:hypothetical protein
LATRFYTLKIYNNSCVRRPEQAQETDEPLRLEAIWLCRHLLTSLPKKGSSSKQRKAWAGTECKPASNAAPISAAFQDSEPVLAQTA